MSMHHTGKNTEEHNDDKIGNQLFLVRGNTIQRIAQQGFHDLIVQIRNTDFG
jgi:hypothetical protein